ncbi:MAG: hypothetical protein EB023_09780, partial [Flavobacteriia bacterium]|nr:hypothetical protein [Flavobacteriia bacterium]
MRVFLLHFLFISLSCFAQSGNEIEKVRRIPGVAGFSSDYVNHQAPKTRGGLPSSFSLKKFVPPVGDQGDKGTCVGWATTYAGMTILNNIDLNRNGASLSINECMSPQMTYDICKIRVDDTCENGIYIKAALNTLVNFGTTTLAKYPYRCAIFDDEKQGVKRVINDSADADEIKDFLSSIRKVRLKGFMSIGGANIIANVKYYLSQNMPVIIGAEMYNSIQSNSVAGVWTGIMDSYPGGHAMCVVGYDDTKEGGAFEILNSWGEDWSSNGYIWFRYADFAKVVDEAYALLGVLREDSASIHNFNFTISANGKKTASILEIVADENYMTSTDLKIGGFAKGLKIQYPESETEYSLAIKSNMEEGFYAYAFGICCGGQVSLLSPVNGANNYYEGLN